MKKSILFISSFLLLSFAKTQITIHPTIGGNLHGIATYKPEGYSRFDDYDKEYFESEKAAYKKQKGGFQIGISADIPLSDRFSFEPGLRFIKKGFLYDDNYSDGDYSYQEQIRLNIRYLELPLMVNFNTELSSGILTFSFGPSIGIQMGGKLKYHYEETDPFTGTYEETETIKNGTGDEATQDSYNYIFKSEDYLLPQEIGLYAGVRYEINNLTLGFTYGQGLSQLVADIENQKSKVLMFNVGYKIEL